MSVDPVTRSAAHPRPRPRPRYGRIAAASAALLTTVVSMLGAAGAFPQPAAAASGGADVATLTAAIDRVHRPAAASTSTSAPASTKASAPVQGPTSHGVPAPHSDPSVSGDATSVPLPADSGSGRRAVFSESQQRVWLVGADGTVRDTYPVSGSLEDNLQPGTYEVYSRSRHAIGIEDSGTMQYFVRFAHGKNAAIGFHDIPVKDGQPLQSEQQLGQPQSHGCIRESEADAQEMWAFAPLGTKVVVTA